MTGFQAKREMAADKQAQTVGSLAPTRLWLDFGFDPSEELDGATLEDLDEETTVSYGKPTEHGIEYVRADLVSPPQRQPLTDEELKKTWYDMKNIMGWYSFQEIARAIEAAHGIKGEAIAVERANAIAQIIALLESQHEFAKHTHNYWLVAANLIRAEFCDGKKAAHGIKGES